MEVRFHIIHTKKCSLTVNVFTQSPTRQGSRQTLQPVAHFHCDASFVFYGFSINRQIITHVFTLLPFIGILLLCQRHDCDELSTPSLASSTELETKETLSSSSIEPQASTSVTSSTTTHTTRLHRITDAPSDETLIDVTTSVDGLCLPDDAAEDNYSITSIGGDIIVTIILHQSDNATEIIKFMVNHINAIDLLVHNVTIGESRVAANWRNPF